LKKYCECFKAGLDCGPSCTCIDCSNGTRSPLALRGTAKKRPFEVASKNSVASQTDDVEYAEPLTPLRRHCFTPPAPMWPVVLEN
jgi:hypothetical protein